MSGEREVKKCSRCQESKPRTSFASNKSVRDGLQAYCRECSAKYYRQRQSAMGRTVREKVPVSPGHKHCRGCGEVKPHSEWHRKTSAPDGLASRCKACKAATDPAGHLRRKYGLTEAQRDEMVASQAGLCAICLKAPAVQVDHCHETGRVRGVLCFNCNSGLGLLRDDPEAMYRAADYLEGNAWKPTLVAPGVYRLPS
ncbi:endonuclease VII domain-containing protein [Streptomyces olivaceus]|uniref:Endonuclease VII domain-containing protein n=1 Tax=Streptomyces olivaceus TaxID=47716 RepID=A0ABS7W570_STROV|nr:endonuclease VII domain-containing protein [Streptomyces sp. VN1]MBZ6090113.1 endonuclease VII domain-containing protein [Streptomyces olivaceus]MCC2267190.1 endonuclease VII domain-containing protein [Streptomyces sp. CT1-17]MBZ6096289.1 endonuclease VII domain-containing protein [Streptomyces olivaceus]MBZ6117315.1 endonuclease VII domain-containing protein [Streptomyces olivaceus]MBZ6152613.1 endonuclease VII domain-containing protein [Streptomyces olivaceus]